MLRAAVLLQFFSYGGFAHRRKNLGRDLWFASVCSSFLLSRGACSLLFAKGAGKLCRADSAVFSFGVDLAFPKVPTGLL